MGLLGFGTCDNILDTISDDFGCELTDTEILDTIHDAAYCCGLGALQERMADLLFDNIKERMPERHKGLLSMYFNYLDTSLSFNGNNVGNSSELSKAMADYDIERLNAIAEEHGWGVYESEDRNGKCAEYSKYSKQGQDFSFTIDEGSGEDMLSAIEEYISDYDPDEEAMLWVGEDGHGKNGAPYRLTDIVKDCEQCLEMVKELRDAWKGYLG